MPTETKEVADLRSKHQVRLVTDEEEGTGIDRLPGGVYGFTYSPGADNFPLFNKPNSHSYEAHKLPDGSAALVGYLTQEEAKKLNESMEATVLHLFPEPKEKAAVLVVLPMTRVLGYKEYSQRAGAGLEIRVGPAS